MIKTKLSSTTCKVLLGMSLALSVQGLVAADIDNTSSAANTQLTDANGQRTFKDNSSGGRDFDFKKQLANPNAGATQNEDITFKFSATPYDDDVNAFNTKNDRASFSVTLANNAPAGAKTSLTFKPQQAGTYTPNAFRSPAAGQAVQANGSVKSINALYNFTLEATDVIIGGGQGQTFNLIAFDDKSEIKGNAVFDSVDLFVGYDSSTTVERTGTGANELFTFSESPDLNPSTAGSLNITGNLTVNAGGADLIFNANALRADNARIQVGGNANLGTIDGQIQAGTHIGLISDRILTLNKAKLLTVTGNNSNISYLNRITDDGMITTDLVAQNNLATDRVTARSAFDVVQGNSLAQANATMLVDYQKYFGDLIKDINGIKNTINGQTYEGLSIPVPEKNGQQQDLLFGGRTIKFNITEGVADLTGLTFYTLSTDETNNRGVRNNDAKNLYVSGGPSAGILSNAEFAQFAEDILRSYRQEIIDWATLNTGNVAGGLPVAGNNPAQDNFRNVREAIQKIDDRLATLGIYQSTNITGAIQAGPNAQNLNPTDPNTRGVNGQALALVNTGVSSGTYTNGGANNGVSNDLRLTFQAAINEGLFRLANNIYVTEFDNRGRVKVDRNPQGNIQANARYSAYQLAADRTAYEALRDSRVANIDKTALKFTRNDVFVQNAQSLGVNIDARNQAIVARFLDGLEMQLKGRVATPSVNDADRTYKEKDLHTRDEGQFLFSKDGGRTGVLVDKDGNPVRNADGSFARYDNSALLDRIALVKFQDSFANNLGNQFRESAKSIANTNSAVSTVNSVINTANDVAIGSRIAMLNNPYGSYASKMSGLKFAAVASDVGANYVDSYSNGIWANVFGGANIIDGDTGGLYGLSLGFDKQATDNVLIGAYFTYAYAEIKDNFVEQDSNNFQLGLYSSIQLAPLWELNLKAYGQISPTDQSRWDMLDNHDTDFTRKSFGLNANIGRSFGFQGDTFIVKPFVGANYYLTRTPSYQESGIAGLNVDSSTNNTLSFDLGAEFRKYLSEESYFFITPKVEQYVLNNGDDFSASLAGIALPSVDGADKKKTYGQVIIGGNFNLSKQFSANIGLGVKQILAGKVDNKNETYATGQLGFKYKF